MGYVITEQNIVKYTVTETTRSLLPRNTDEVVVGGYIPVADSGGTPLNSASGGRSYFNNAHESRIRQNGNITKVKFYIKDAVSWENVTAYYFQVWRKDGATYDLVGEEDILSSLSINTINTVTLATPIAAIEGDFIAVHIEGDCDRSTYGKSGYTTGLRYYSGAKPATSNFNWDAQASLDYVIIIEAYMQAPLMIGIGDSIMAGHPGNYSFIESSFITNVSNQIMYQLNQLDDDMIYQNMGIGGENSTEVEARFTEDVIDKKPTYVVIMVGVNDLASSAPKATYIANLTSMLDECKDAGVMPIIIKILPWTDGSDARMQYRDDWMSDLQTLLGSYASYWVDCDTAVGEFRDGGDADNLWDIQAAYDQDGVHLNEAGYAKVALTIKNKIL